MTAKIGSHIMLQCCHCHHSCLPYDNFRSCWSILSESWTQRSLAQNNSNLRYCFHSRGLKVHKKVFLGLFLYVKCLLFNWFWWVIFNEFLGKILVRKLPISDMKGSKNFNFFIFHQIVMQFFVLSDQPHGLLMDHKHFSYFISKRCLKWAKIPKIHVFGSYIEFLFLIQFWWVFLFFELIVLRTSLDMGRISYDIHDKNDWKVPISKILFLFLFFIQFQCRYFLNDHLIRFLIGHYNFYLL